MNLGRLHCESGVLHGTCRVSSLYSVCLFDAIIKHCFIILSTHSIKQIPSFFLSDVVNSDLCVLSSAQAQFSDSGVLCHAGEIFPRRTAVWSRGSPGSVPSFRYYSFMLLSTKNPSTHVLCSFIVGNSGRLAQYQLSCRREAEKLIDRFVLTSGI